MICSEFTDFLSFRKCSELLQRDQLIWYDTLDVGFSGKISAKYTLHWHRTLKYLWAEIFDQTRERQYVSFNDAYEQHNQ